MGTSFKAMRSMGSRQPTQTGETESIPTARAKPSPELKANVISKFSWQWLQSLVILGNKRPLQQEDLYDMNPKESTEYLEHLWKKAIEKRAQQVPAACTSSSSRFPPIWPILFTALGKEYFLASLFKPVWLTALLVQVYVLKALVKSAGKTDNDLTWWWGALLVLAMLGTSMAQSISIHGILMLSQKAGMKVRSIVATAVFDKVLAMKSVALADTSSGQLVNLVTNDTQKLLDAAMMFHFVWFSLIELVVLAGFCIWEAGVSAIPGVVLSFCTQPLLVWMGRSVGRLRRKAVECTDARVRLVGEILAGIRVVKYNGWTSAFLTQVEELRNKELRWIKRAAYLRAATSTIRDATTPLASLVTFGTYVALHDGILNPSKAFAILALFSLLVRVFSVAPIGIQYAGEALVAVQRLKKVLDMPYGDPDPEKLNQHNKEPVSAEEGTTFSWELSNGLDEDPTIKTARKRTSSDRRSCSLRRNASLRIEDETTKEQELQSSMSELPGGFILHNVHINVTRGDVVAIVGPVGSGKSSLLLALLNEMHKLRGSFYTEKAVAYVPQEPWIFNATVRENILFGNQYDEERYRKVIFACALEHDITQFEAGHETEIGEKGINLSGGQRARVSLARACYSSAGVVFLDDPLAAVDVPTARHLMLHVLDGVLKGRTVILVTHNKNALRFCNQVYLMQNGQLQRLQKDYVSKHPTILSEEGQEQAFQTVTDNVQDEDTGVMEVVHALDKQNHISNPPKNISNLEALPVESLRNDDSAGHGNAQPTTGDASREGALTVKEDRVEGMVTLSNYVAYLRGAGLAFCAVVAAVFLLGQAVRVMVDFWLGVWVDSRYNLKTYEYVSIYAAFAMGALILSLGRAFLFTEAAMLAAENLHDRMAEKVFRSPQTFFDQNPAGRILNRFSKDQALVDELLPYTAQQMCEYMVACLGTVVLIIMVIPWFVLAMPPFLIGFVLLQRRYVAISRELKRLDGTSRSPMYEHFAQTVAGAPSIRAYGVKRRAHDRFVALIDANHRAFILFAHSGRWLGIRLDFLAAISVTVTALLVVLLRKRLDAGLAGVVLVQSLQLTGFFQYGVRLAADTENYFTSVERIQAYATLPTEADSRTPPGLITPDWPSSGSIEFRNYTMAYREDLPPVLNNLSFRVEPQAKVGIMGRTGAGKSSLAAAIFRMVENNACHGTILVDGIDIKLVGLDDLRQRISIIPQDPVLYRGTVRMNLDPFSQHSDGAMNAALDSVHLKKKIQSLDTIIETNGGNFSVGQRQLLCLARALLRNSRIIVMDEATAAVDTETDKLIQKTMREAFRECSVLTIAHRIETVIDSDLVLVLAKGGRIVEFDSPANLLRCAQDTEGCGTTSPTKAELRSVFAEMVAQSGQDIARQLRHAAEAAEAIKLRNQ